LAWKLHTEYTMRLLLNAKFSLIRERGCVYGSPKGVQIRTNFRFFVMQDQSNKKLSYR